MRIRHAAAFIFLSLAGCRWPVDPAVRAIVVAGDSLTLEWAEPPYGMTGVLSVSSWDVYVRRHGTQSWELLGSVPATRGPEMTVSRSRLGSGSFDFAVDAVNTIGQVSPLHASVDPDAYPPGGWYVVWN